MKYKVVKAKKIRCKFCSGKGWTLDYWAICGKCNGSGEQKT